MKILTLMSSSNKNRVFIFILLLQLALSESEFEKFFEIEGGPQYMYYFLKIKVGSQGADQSAIIDTGSDTLAFPCDQCTSEDCGSHQDPRFPSANSTSFALDLDCPSYLFDANEKICRFVKSYAEGSSLFGFLAKDYIRFKNAQKVSDPKLQKLNTFATKSLRLRAEFGCTTKETGLFKTQYADGILGLDNSSTFITSVQDKGIGDNTSRVLSFGLCFHSGGGIMSVDLRKADAPDDKLSVLERQLGDYREPPIVASYSDSGSYYRVQADSFEIEGTKADLSPISIMIDSGTTFSHFPDHYIESVLQMLNEFCSRNRDRCGKMASPNFRTSTCLELKQPDENYGTIAELLDSFPDILIHIANSTLPYVLKPKNYFYEEFEDNPNTGDVKICIALKGEEEGQIILGAFAMIDNFFYFDRKAQKVMIFKEDCFLRTQQLLKKKRERILQEKVQITKKNYLTVFLTLALVLSLIAISFFFLKKKKKSRILNLQIAKNLTQNEF